MQGRRIISSLAVTAPLVVALALQACARSPQPQMPDAPPVTEARAPAPPPPPPPPVELSPEEVFTPPPPVPAELSPEDEFARRSLEELNRDSPLEPVFFGLDSSELDDSARRAVEANAEVLLRFASWVVTIEGHCDERGTGEYNLGLGERRALAARQYLVQLGLDPNRVQTVSYGEEFPFDPGHDDTAWAANRRAHFVVTAR